MKRGYLLMNTGSPDRPTEDAVRIYLKAFLMDPFIIDLPYPLRYALVHWAILPKRPKKSAQAYESIWTNNGSPLVHYCKNLARQLKAEFDEPIELGMAYGKPPFKTAIENLLNQGVEEIVLLPLFPQYASATIGSCETHVKKTLKGRANLRVIPPFYLHPTYIQPQAERLKTVSEHILFSYHGLPLRQLKKQAAPNYKAQCMATTEALVKAANIPEDRYTIAFQSRLGRAEWIQPYTEETLRNMPKNGIKNLAVICPAFFCDCLETLEEIKIHSKKIFMDAGGKSFRMIPCLNDSPEAVHCLKTLMNTENV